MKDNRRQVASRKVPFFQNFAKRLVRLGLTPNQVSILSVVFAAIGGLALSQVSKMESLEFYFYSILGLIGIQLRLICNLIDGLMAVEGGLRTPNGELYNDLPDRFSDLFLFLGAGFAIPFSWGTDLSWATAVLAILTAYVRVLGASMQMGHDFSGPMAKQHRMFILNIVIVVGIVEHAVIGHVQYSYLVGLSVIALGGLATIIARLSKLNAKLTTFK